MRALGHGSSTPAHVRRSSARATSQAETKKAPKAAPAEKSKSGKKLTGFMKFSKDNREQVKTDNPGISFGQIGKRLGELWRELDAGEKEKYNA
jgi:hypothetical protein